MSLVFEDKTKVLRRCFFDVHNEVGLARQEEDYHKGCQLWLEENQIPLASKPPHPVMFEGEVAHTLYPDFVVWDSITVELKAVARSLRDTEYVQLFDYLKCRRGSLGLLVNMGLDRVHVERILYDPPEPGLVENWNYWTGKISGRDREVGLEVRDALRAVYDAHGTGYGQEVLAQLILHALRRRRLSLVASPISKAYYRGIELHESPLDCFVIEGRILLTFTALFDGNDFNINRGKSYGKALDLTWGIAANFGKTHAQLTGLRRSS